MRSYLPEFSVIQPKGLVDALDAVASEKNLRPLAGGTDVENQYVFLNTLPLEEANHNKELAAYGKAVGPDNADAFGATALAD